jgi:hypothetical protein
MVYRLPLVSVAAPIKASLLGPFTVEVAVLDELAVV